MSSLLYERVVWVIGASGAIGSAIARHAAAEGAQVIASGRSAEKLDVLTQAITHAGHTACPLVTDVTYTQSIREAAEIILKKYKRIDCLVNSTSVSAFGAFEDLTDAQWEDVLDTKLMGYMRTMRTVLPIMRAQHCGVIVNITGRSGRQPSATHLPGGCANAAINLLSKGLADAYAKAGIRINTIAPGPIISVRLDQLQASTANFPGQTLQTFNQAGTPMDVAQACVWLLSDQAKHITGTNLAVDGGATATV